MAQMEGYDCPVWADIEANYQTALDNDDGKKRKLWGIDVMATVHNNLGHLHCQSQ